MKHKTLANIQSGNVISNSLVSVNWHIHDMRLAPSPHTPGNTTLDHDSRATRHDRDAEQTQERPTHEDRIATALEKLKDHRHRNRLERLLAFPPSNAKSDIFHVTHGLLKTIHKTHGAFEQFANRLQDLLLVPLKEDVEEVDCKLGAKGFTSGAIEELKRQN